MPNESELHAGRPAAEPPHGPERGPGYETRDTSVRSILIFIVGLFIALAMTQYGMWTLLRGIAGGRPERADPMAVLVGAERQHVMLRRDEEKILEGYGRGEGVPGEPGTAPYRIPIDVAIKLVAERGLKPATGPARTEVEVNSTHQPGVEPVDRSKQQERNDAPEPARKGQSSEEKGTTR